jgi:hypothetical protein
MPRRPARVVGRFFFVVVDVFIVSVGLSAPWGRNYTK